MPGGGEGSERGVGDARAESEVEMRNGGVAMERSVEELGAEGFEGLAVAGLDGVERLAAQREGLFGQRLVV